MHIQTLPHLNSMISFKCADHIHICVPPERLEEARLFYTDLLGLPEIHRPVELSSPGHWFLIGNMELHIGVEAPLPQTLRHTAFVINDVKAARDYLESKSVKCICENSIFGRQRFSFADPFGNRMELMEFDIPATL